MPKRRNMRASLAREDAEIAAWNAPAELGARVPTHTLYRTPSRQVLSGPLAAKMLATGQVGMTRKGRRDAMAPAKGDGGVTVNALDFRRKRDHAHDTGRGTAGQTARRGAQIAAYVDRDHR